MVQGVWPVSDFDLCWEVPRDVHIELIIKDMEQIVIGILEVLEDQRYAVWCLDIALICLLGNDVQFKVTLFGDVGNGELSKYYMVIGAVDLYQIEFQVSLTIVRDFHCVILGTKFQLDRLNILINHDGLLIDLNGRIKFNYILSW